MKHIKNYIPKLATILVEIAVEEVLESGIVLTASDNKENTGQDYGKVLALGPDAFKPPVTNTDQDIHVGDYVAFKRYAGLLVSNKHDKKIIRLIQDTDVFAKVEYGE